MLISGEFFNRPIIFNRFSDWSLKVKILKFHFFDIFLRTDIGGYQNFSEDLRTPRKWTYLDETNLSKKNRVEKVQIVAEILAFSWVEMPIWGLTAGVRPPSLKRL